MNKENKWQRWKGIMKAYPFEEKRLAKWEPPYIVQPKYDGDRCVNEPAGDTSLLLTSEENVFFGVPHINEELRDSGLYKLPLDGELYSHHLFLEGGHELIHSICSRKVELHPRFNEMCFYIFDVKLWELSQAERQIFLEKLDFSRTPHVKLAPRWISGSLEDIKRVYDNLVKRQYEGIVVRHLQNLYQEKRSTFLMKFKPKKMDVYTIIGWNEETTMEGVPKGRLGSVILSSQTGDEFSVGAGLDDNEKDYWWKHRDTLAGRQAIVHYQHLTNNQIPKGTFDIEILEQTTLNNST